MVFSPGACEGEEKRKHMGFVQRYALCLHKSGGEVLLNLLPFVKKYKHQHSQQHRCLCISMLMYCESGANIMNFSFDTAQWEDDVDA